MNEPVKLGVKRINILRPFTTVVNMLLFYSTVHSINGKNYQEITVEGGSGEKRCLDT